MQINVINKSNHKLPKYETKGSAGLDLTANIDKPLKLKRFQRVSVPTGIFMEIPVGYEAQVRARSGLAINHGISLVNGIGTIDSDYRGEVKVILINLGKKKFMINPGDRIGQLVFAKCEQAEWFEVEELNKTERGPGGMGHTGIKKN